MIWQRKATTNGKYEMGLMSVEAVHFSELREPYLIFLRHEFSLDNRIKWVFENASDG